MLRKHLPTHDLTNYDLSNVNLCKKMPSLTSVHVTSCLKPSYQDGRIRIMTRVDSSLLQKLVANGGWGHTYAKKLECTCHGVVWSNRSSWIDVVNRTYCGWLRG